MSREAPGARTPGGTGEVLAEFSRLGVTSFGGPVAHLGYFRDAFVGRRKWLDDAAYADLVALCQFLPGPASSQVGMGIGLQRAGLSGMLTAWAAFTLPSAALLVAFAYGASALGGLAGSGWIAGLMAAAAAVVAQAVIGMARNLAPDAQRATIAAAAMIAVVLLPHALTQIGVIVGAGIVGLVWLRPEESDGSEEPRAASSFPVRVPIPVAIGCLVTFGVLLVALPIAASATGDATLRLVDIFYRAGALVFGGGHVVLPLLESETVATGLVDGDLFLAGYGVAQAVPGPLFTFAAYLGAVTTSGPTGVVGGAIALVAIFLPSALLIVGALPFWDRLRRARGMRRAMAGVNAGVVGILAAALYDPVLTHGVTSPPSLAVAVAAFVALLWWKAPPWAVVVAAAVVGGLVL